MSLKIVENKESLELHQLSNGDIFKYVNDFYIIVDDDFSLVKAFNLTLCNIEDLSEYCEVIPVNATLTID